MAISQQKFVMVNKAGEVVGWLEAYPNMIPNVEEGVKLVEVESVGLSNGSITYTKKPGG